MLYILHILMECAEMRVSAESSLGLYESAVSQLDRWWSLMQRDTPRGTLRSYQFNKRPLT